MDTAVPHCLLLGLASLLWGAAGRSAG